MPMLDIGRVARLSAVLAEAKVGEIAMALVNAGVLRGDDVPSALMHARSLLEAVRREIDSMAPPPCVTPRSQDSQCMHTRPVRQGVEFCVLRDGHEGAHRFHGDREVSS